jgi:hypothetical protein
MSINNIQLSSFLVGELYKNFLVDSDNQQLNTKISKADELLFLGKNQKNILLIVNEENAVYITDENLNFLVDILSACKLSLSDSALVNLYNNKEIHYKQLNEKFKPEIIVFFGIEPVKLGFPLQFPNYQLQQYNHQTYLSTPSLKELAADKQQKLQLWACLKKLFSI